jgi:hypothetical protein
MDNIVYSLSIREARVVKKLICLPQEHILISYESNEVCKYVKTPLATCHLWKEIHFVEKRGIQKAWQATSYNKTRLKVSNSLKHLLSLYLHKFASGGGGVGAP